MDIDLLSKMVKELILDQDRVALPGLGSFVAEIVPSTFSDKGYTINPPYRRLYFRSKPDAGDELMSFYASSNNVEMDVAEKIIRDYVSELKAVLHEKKTVVFPGLGRLRATKENNVFFVADESLDIYPAGFGLEPVSLKTHQETPEEVAAAVEGLKTLLDVQEVAMAAPVPQPTPSSAPAPVPAQTPTPDRTPAPEVAPAPVSDPVAGPTPEPTPETIAAADPEPAPEPDVVVEAALEVAQKPAAEVKSEPVPEVEPEVEDKPQPVQEKKGNPFFKALLVTFITVLILLVAYVLVARLYPEFTDRLLYTPEELEIINS